MEINTNQFFKIIPLLKIFFFVNRPIIDINLYPQSMVTLLFIDSLFWKIYFRIIFGSVLMCNNKLKVRNLISCYSLKMYKKIIGTYLFYTKDLKNSSKRDYERLKVYKIIFRWNSKNLKCRLLKFYDVNINLHILTTYL